MPEIEGQGSRRRRAAREMPALRLPTATSARDSRSHTSTRHARGCDRKPPRSAGDPARLAGELIMLDQMLPILDGWGFLAEHRRMGIAASTPVMIVSAARQVLRRRSQSWAWEAVPCVHDQGAPIPAEERGLLFSPFRQGSVARTRSTGAGLGLFIVQRILRAHGGSIEMWSRPRRPGRSLRPVCRRRCRPSGTAGPKLSPRDRARFL